MFAVSFYTYVPRPFTRHYAGANHHWVTRQIWLARARRAHPHQLFLWKPQCKIQFEIPAQDAMGKKKSGRLIHLHHREEGKQAQKSNREHWKQQRTHYAESKFNDWITTVHHGQTGEKKAHSVRHHSDGNYRGSCRIMAVQKKANSFSMVANTFKNNHLIKNQFFADKFVTNYLWNDWG